MSLPLAASLAVVAAYLIGSIPFAYVLVRGLKGIDIRTVGSGNVGATNAGRVLGPGGFLGVFVLDLLKGLGPTLLLPRAVEAVAGPAGPAVPVLVALAAILGHNFPLYLGFRGGKGVATSFGAFAALDPVAIGGALAAFLVMLVLTRYVSMSSMLGAICFAAVHFAQVDQPWSRDQLPMSVVTIALVVLLVVRHRANLRRIAQGTEPRVRFAGRRGRREAGETGS